MKDEIYEIPYRAELCYSKNKGIILPQNVPYLGMGSSYFAALGFKYLAVDVFSENALSYYHYLSKKYSFSEGVLISQSGESSDTINASSCFQRYTAIVNEPDSSLANHPNCKQVILLQAGNEKRVPTKTYLNTLLVLYLGLGFNPWHVLKTLRNKLEYFEQTGLNMGKLIYKQLRQRKKKNIVVLGNGPNEGTAQHAALILSEITKFPALALTSSQYNHGFKETAENTVVIAINPEGKEARNTKKLLQRVKAAGAVIFELKNAETNEIFSPLTLPVPFFFATA